RGRARHRNGCHSKRHRGSRASAPHALRNDHGSRGSFLRNFHQHSTATPRIAITFARGLNDLELLNPFAELRASSGTLNDSSNQSLTLILPFGSGRGKV